MKKIRFFALMGVIALTSALAFTSCKKDKNDEVAPSGKNDVVKTQFALTIPTTSNSRSNAPRRMNGVTVQKTGFRSLTDIVLFPFAVTDSIEGAHVRLGNPLSLSTPQELRIGKDYQKSRLYSDVEVPVGTSSFLFYAKADPNESGLGVNPDSVGKTDYKLGSSTVASITDMTKPEDLFFAPSQRCATANLGADETATKISKYLTSIAQAQITTPAAMTWRGTLGKGGSGNESLDTLYVRFSSLQAGSSASVKAAVSDLYATLKPMDDNKAALPEALRNLPRAIMDSILAPTWVSVDGDGIAFASDGGIDGFPANQNLPDGAASVTCVIATGVFSYVNSSVPGLTQMGLTAANKFVYAAELLYLANTTIHVADELKLQNYTGAGDGDATGTYWSAFIAANYGSQRTVTTSTRSVILDTTINYGVSRFDVTAKLGDAIALKDRNDDDVSKPDGGFPLTGVLVARQNKVNYMFHPDGSDNFVIYDNATNGVKVSDADPSSTDTIHTLVYETERADEDDQLFFALEFTNTTNDFVGKNGIVPTGTKFYLVGHLKATDAAMTAVGADTHYFFKQDHWTKVNCTISDLRKAYNVIPDLRTAELELGLSVDIKWQSGYTFTVEDWD